VIRITRKFTRNVIDGTKEVGKYLSEVERGGFIAGFGSGGDRIGVNEAVRTCSVSKTTFKRYNTGKISVVPICHPMEINKCS
jgi:hypothetical protein